MIEVNSSLSILLDYNYHDGRMHKSTQYNVDNTELSTENGILKKLVKNNKWKLWQYIATFLWSNIIQLVISYYLLTSFCLGVIRPASYWHQVKNSRSFHFASFLFF